MGLIPRGSTWNPAITQSERFRKYNGRLEAFVLFRDIYVVVMGIGEAEIPRLSGCLGGVLFRQICHCPTSRLMRYINKWGRNCLMTNGISASTSPWLSFITSLISPRSWHSQPTAASPRLHKAAHRIGIPSSLVRWSLPVLVYRKNCSDRRMLLLTKFPSTSTLGLWPIPQPVWLLFVALNVPSSHENIRHRFTWQALRLTPSSVENIHQSLLPLNSILESGVCELLVVTVHKETNIGHYQLAIILNQWSTHKWRLVRD